MLLFPRALWFLLKAVLTRKGAVFRGCIYVDRKSSDRRCYLSRTGLDTPVLKAENTVIISNQQKVQTTWHQPEHSLSSLVQNLVTLEVSSTVGKCRVLEWYITLEDHLHLILSKCRLIRPEM